MQIMLGRENAPACSSLICHISHLNIRRSKKIPLWWPKFKVFCINYSDIVGGFLFVLFCVSLCYCKSWSNRGWSCSNIIISFNVSRKSTYMSIADVVSPLPPSSSPYHSSSYLFLPLPFSHQFALLPTFNTSLPPFHSLTSFFFWTVYYADLPFSHILLLLNSLLWCWERDCSGTNQCTSC